MAFVPAKCTSCGAEIQLDDTQERGFCSYCGHHMLFSAAESFFKQEENAERASDETIHPTKSFSEYMLALNKILERKMIKSHMMPREKVEVDDILKAMRVLEPDNCYLLMYEALIAFYHFNNYNLSFAPGLFHIRQTCYQIDMPGNEEMPKSPVIVGGELMRKQYSFSPMRLGDWERHTNGHFGDNVRILEPALRALDAFANCDKIDTLKTVFADSFMSLLGNHNIYYRYSAPAGENSYKYEYWCHHIQAGEAISIGRDIHYSGMYDNNKGATMYEEIVYMPGARKKPEYCVADNVVEFLIPLLKKSMQSANKNKVIDGLFDEVHKYPTSYSFVW